MVRRRHRYDSVVLKVARERVPAETPDTADHRLDQGKYCAYNQTRERFLGSLIHAEDLSETHIDERLPALTQRSGEGLWLVPFRGISPTSVRTPLDLVYLDRDCAVLETVESFPIFSAPVSSAAASVLVLPAGAVHSTGTQPGDRLILCAPAEMKQRLQSLASPNPDAGAVAVTEEPAVSTDEVPAHSGTGRLLHWEGHAKLRSQSEGSPVADSAQAKVLVDEPATQKIAEERPQDKISNPQLAQEKLPEVTRPSEKVLEAIRVPEVPPVELKPSAPEAPKPAAPKPAEHESEEKSAKPARSWLQRFLNPEPPQPRKALRESLPGLTAYFFTGGAPVAHAVRDISKTGMYVFTEERWYPGTVVRMTLTDSLQPTAEYSITLNMAVMRSGDDGVGLQFVTRSDQSRRGKQLAQQDMMGATSDESQIEQFLQRFRREKGKDSAS